MREIKFRAWDNLNAKMIFPTLHTSTGNFSSTLPVLLELLQYVNKDSQGNDIYEGDIIVHSSNNEEYPTPVRFYDGAFRIDTELGTVIDDWHAAHSRVIGNIYQNPDLLQKGGK